MYQNQFWVCSQSGSEVLSDALDATCFYSRLDREKYTLPPWTNTFAHIWEMLHEEVEAQVSSESVSEVRPVMQQERNLVLLQRRRWVGARLRRLQLHNCPTFLFRRQLSVTVVAMWKKYKKNQEEIQNISVRDPKQFCKKSKNTQLSHLLFPPSPAGCDRRRHVGCVVQNHPFHNLDHCEICFS